MYLKGEVDAAGARGLMEGALESMEGASPEQRPIDAAYDVKLQTVIEKIGAFINKQNDKWAIDDFYFINNTGSCVSYSGGAP